MSLQEMVLRCLEESGESESTWSDVASIISTVAWSVSFYGQVYENWKYKSVEGFSLDYLYLNLIGYTFYGIYSTIGFFTTIKGAGTHFPYSHRNGSFGRSHLCLSCYTNCHCRSYSMSLLSCIFFAQKKRGKNKLSKWAMYLGITLIFFALLEFLLTEINVFEWTEFWNPVSALGYGKLIISFVKYSPAVYWNWKRKSTKGWSIFNIILDLVGGTFSLASGSISVQNGLNVTKLFLAILTVFYDLIFVVQHYVLYRGNDQKSQSQKLVEDLVSVEEHIQNINRTETQPTQSQAQNSQIRT